MYPYQSVPPREGTGPVTPQWPLRSSLELGALPGAVPCARLHTRQVLWEWRVAELSENTELVVSELVTNAVRASSGDDGYGPGYDRLGRQRSVLLRLASDGHQVLAEVQDSSLDPPEPGKQRAGGISGRGLLMVAAVSTQWGYYYVDARMPGENAGKVVWALLG